MTVAQRFARARPRLLRLAYSQLGDVGEAEDVVQEAWLRLERTGADSIDDLDAWLTTVVGRLALDALRSARARREQYVGPWLPEPILSSGAVDPADRVTLDESVSYALLALLEQLSPAERTAFVLHDVFECRSARSRRSSAARRKPCASSRRAPGATSGSSARASRPRRTSMNAPCGPSRTPSAKETSTASSPCSTPTSCGPPTAAAARSPCVSRCTAPRVSRAAGSRMRRNETIGPAPSPIELNGELGLLIAGRDGNGSVLSFAVDGGRITRIDVVRNPDKLRRVATGPP